jgi:hypothetical protein
MFFLMIAAVLSAAPTPPKPLPDVPAPLGRLVDVLVEPQEQPGLNEKIVGVELSGCEHPVRIHVTRFVSGAMYAMQQLAEWLNQTPGLEAQLFARKGVVGEVIQGLTHSLPGEQHACAAPPKDLTNGNWGLAAPSCALARVRTRRGCSTARSRRHSFAGRHRRSACRASTRCCSTPKVRRACATRPTSLA